MMWVMSREVIQEQEPFEVAWRTIDGLKIRYATNGRGGEKVVRLGGASARIRVDCHAMG